MDLQFQLVHYTNYTTTTQVAAFLRHVWHRLPTTVNLSPSLCLQLNPTSPCLTGLMLATNRQRASPGLLIGDEHFDFVEGLLGTRGCRGGRSDRFGVSRAGVGAGDVDFLACTSRGLGVGEVCDEHDALTGQHWKEKGKGQFYQRNIRDREIYTQIYVMLSIKN